MVGEPYGFGEGVIRSSTPDVLGVTWAYEIIADDGFESDSGITLNKTTGAITAKTPGGTLPAAVEGVSRTYNFTVVYDTKDKDLIIGVSKPVNLSITIWSRPVITTDNRLKDGMAGPAVPSLEPDEVAYNYKLNATTFPYANAALWQWSAPSSITVTPDKGITPVAGTLPVAFTNVNGGEATLSGFVASTAQGSYRFVTNLRPAPLSPTLTVNPILDNPNMKDAVIQRLDSDGNPNPTFILKIWKRHYMHVNTADILRTGFVYRFDEGSGLNWSTITTDPTELVKYSPKRAVMPTDQGVARVPGGGVGSFVRWEVESVFDTTLLSQVKIGRPLPAAILTEGLDGWAVDSVNSYARVTMPGLDDPDVTTASDITLRGELIAGTPEIRLMTTTAQEGVEFTGGTLQFVTVPGRNDIGTFGPIPTPPPPSVWTQQPTIKWKVLEGYPPGELSLPEPAPGIYHIPTLEGPFSMITGTPPLQSSGEYTFTMGITLPGTMIIERTFTLTIEPALGVLIGDVNSDDRVDLADLIMLWRYQMGLLTAAELRRFDLDAANIKNSTPASVTPADFNALRDYFTDPAAVSDVGTRRIVPGR